MKILNLKLFIILIHHKLFRLNEDDFHRKLSFIYLEYLELFIKSIFIIIFII